MTAFSVQELVPRYVDAWNDPDPASRRSELASLYREDGRIVMRTGVYDGIDYRIGEAGCQLRLGRSGGTPSRRKLTEM